MRQGTRWTLASGLGMALAAVVVYGLSLPASDSLLGRPAPDFQANRLPAGERVSLSQHRGQVVLLNIWATWCAPCEAEMPSIQRLYQELGPQGLRVLAVSVDVEASPADVQRWAAERKLTFDILHDPTRKIEELYRSIGVPESFVIDRDGNVVKRVTGYVLEWDSPAQKALFRRLLRDKRQETSDRAVSDSSPVSRLLSLR